MNFLRRNFLYSSKNNCPNHLHFKIYLTYINTYLNTTYLRNLIYGLSKLCITIFSCVYCT